MYIPKPRIADQVWHRYLGRPYRLHVTDHGGSGQVVILLHGIGSSSANWVELVPLLVKNYHCISIDLLGFGESAKPKWCQYAMKDHLRSTTYTINQLKLPKHFILMGHSLGSLLATRYALENPSKVSRLVLLSPPVYLPANLIDKLSARQMTSLYLKAYRFIRTHPKASLENILRLSRILPHTKFMTLNADTWLPFIRSLEQCIETQTMIDDIRHTKAPADIFYGMFDEVIVPYNITLLGKVHSISIHPLRVNHMVGKRYATAVAKYLISPNDTSIFAKSKAKKTKRRQRRKT